MLMNSSSFLKIKKDGQMDRYIASHQSIFSSVSGPGEHFIKAIGSAYHGAKCQCNY